MSLLVLLRPATVAEPVTPPAPFDVTTFSGRPTGQKEISYEDPADPPVWEDESAYLVRWTLDRGRSSELDTQQAGTCSQTMINTTGRFDPVNASGDHYPNVLPMRRERLTTTIPTEVPPFTLRSSNLRDSDGDALRAGPVAVPLFAGYVESWSQTWALSNGDAAALIRAVDAFKIFNLFTFVWGFRYRTLDPGPDDWGCGGSAGFGNVTPDNGPPFIPDELSGKRIERLLDCIGWPEEDRLIDPGTVTIWGSNQSVGGTTNIPVNANALQHLNDIAATEGGLLFVDKLGRIRFIDADHLPELDPLEVYGGETGEIHFRDITADFDDSRLWNSITVTTTASSLTGFAPASDATSMATFYPREHSVTLLPCSNADMQARADALLARYKDPGLRLSRIEVIPGTSHEWRRVLSREIGDVVLVRKRPGGADMIERELRIEGIHIDAPGQVRWGVVWEVSPA